MSDTFISILAGAFGALVILILREIVIGAIRHARNKEMVDYNHDKHVLLENVKVKNSTRSAIRIEEFKSEINKELEREKGVIQIEVQKELEPFKKQLEKGNAIAISTFTELLKVRHQKVNPFYKSLVELFEIAEGNLISGMELKSVSDMINTVKQDHIEVKLFLPAELSQLVDQYLGKVRIAIINSQFVDKISRKRNGTDSDLRRMTELNEKLLILLEDVKIILHKIEEMMRNDMVGLKHLVESTG